jgi:hypothetical protein
MTDAPTKRFSTTLPDGKVKGFNALGQAIEFADGYSEEHNVELDVVATADSVVAYVATPVRDRIFYPFERVETPKFRAPQLDGYRTAYTRKRIEATVYRALDHTDWLVHDGRTGNTKTVRTTRQACILTREMRQGKRL